MRVLGGLCRVAELRRQVAGFRRRIAGPGAMLLLFGPRKTPRHRFPDTLQLSLLRRREIWIHPSWDAKALMGWAGATDKSLSKFSELLAAEGLISVRCTLPISYLFSPIPYPRRSWATSLLAFLEQQALSPPRPLVLYAFSNGGAYVVQQIQSLVENNPRYARYRQLIVGFIFDSAPAYVRRSGGLKVLDASMQPGLGRFGAKAAFRVSSWASSILDGRQMDEFWDSMLRLDRDKPQLYLYSQDDPLCDADKLTELIEKKRQRGQSVTSHKWEQSEHVGHYKVHREEYLAELLPFLQSLHGNQVVLQSKL